MHNTVGKNKVRQLRISWTNKALLSSLVYALGFTVLVSTILYILFAMPFYGILPILILSVLVAALLTRRSKLTDDDVSRFLNMNVPSLEESAHLVLKSPSELNLLESLQVHKIVNELELVQGLDPFKRRFAISLIVLLLASVISFALFKLPVRSGLINSKSLRKQASSVSPIPEKHLAQIKTAEVIITPPSYTGKGMRQQNIFNLLAEEGAVVAWQIQTNIEAKKVQLIFNDGNTLSLLTDGRQLNWRTQKVISQTGFYQVKVDDHLSELYKIETIKDKPPVIIIQTPKPSSFINYGQSETVLLKGILTDDYGIRNTYISATISSGKGEGVRFKEQRLSLPSFKPGQKQIAIHRSIDCKALGMNPGDELYFFISSVDNQNQETRSEVYIITLQDTSNLTGMNGMVMPLDIKAELFRSQRQIIIETEQLLKNKSRISVEAFTKKSNDLGIDQKLLRMRYGKFLGEETDVEIGGDHQDEGGEQHSQETEDIVKQYSHLHDNAEDATFFDAETKKQLKATLTEMWNAEMKLRTILPKEALPYEYKALRLLKDLQQKSRVYVAKTGLKTTPLQLNKRLTGDLSKVNQPVIRENISRVESGAKTVRLALGILEEVRMGRIVDNPGKEILQKAFYQLSTRAAYEPSLYIPSLSALKNIINEKFRVKDIVQAQQGLQKMAPSAEKLPFRARKALTGLSKQYFINLKKSGKP